MRASILASFLLVCGSAGAAAQEEIKLRYRFKAGQKQAFVMESKMTITMNLAGMDIEAKMIQSMEMNWEVKKVDDKGIASMEMTIGRTTMKLDSFIGVFEVDSDDAKEPEDKAGKALSQVVKSMAGARITLKKDARGQVSGVQIPEDVRKKLANLPDDGLGANFDEGSLRAMAEGGIAFADTIARGKTWDQLQKLDVPGGKIDNLVKYTYQGQEARGDRKVAKLSYLQEMKIEPPMNGNAKVAIKSGQGKGHAYFDNRRGLLLEQTAETTMRMDIEVAGMTLTQNIEQNTTIRLKEEK